MPEQRVARAVPPSAGPGGSRLNAMSSQESPGTAGNTPEQTPAAPERRGVTVRRAPRYVPFLILGALVGIAVAAFIAFGAPGDESYDPGSLFGFFMVLCGAGGAILGAIAALVLDRLSVRRAEHAVVEAVADTETESVPDEGPEHDGGTGNREF
jgi:hypothetical protein